MNMAEQIPYGVVVCVINRLGSLAFREIGLIYGVKTEMERLKDTVEAIKAVLLDAEQRQQHDLLVKIWIRRLKEVLHDADDLLDELHTEDLLRKRDGKGKVRDFFSSQNHIAFRLKIAHKIKKIREKFNGIAEDVSKLNLVQRVVVMGPNESKSHWRDTSSFVHQEDIIGREKDKKEIIDLLFNTNSNQDVSLVAIVGIGGLGKTALAQLVYNDAKVKKRFQKQMWICVSEDFDVKALVNKILESLIGNKVDDLQIELLQNKLQENLNGQRYLLVLDDIWNEDPKKWDDLRKHLMCGAQGSKILVTTRKQIVTKSMGVKNPYVLEGLTKDQSWALLKRLAFGEGARIITPNLETIGQRIAVKCKGVPLAIKTFGGMLRVETEESNWEMILEGEFWKSSALDDDASIMPILKLSYDNLSIELRQCFAFCSLYPKDWRYEKDDLIQLWMAQGYLECANDKQCMEDVGEQYFHILLMRSFFQDIEMNDFGEIKYFKMHDLMHDISQSIAGFDCCLYGEETKSVPKPMHVSFDYSSNCSLDLLDASRLRTILRAKMLFKDYSPKIKNSERLCYLDLSFLKFKRLHYLDLSFCAFRGDLPKSIGKLKHLRYLGLSRCKRLTGLPKTITNLLNLHTLNLDYCIALKFSIENVTKLINLRHLTFDSCPAFEDGMPIGLENLTSLQKLSHFIVGDVRKTKNAKLNELKELNLREELVIDNLYLVRDVEGESRNVNLKAKKYLRSLHLRWGSNGDMKNSDCLQLMENLCPHPNLKALAVRNYPGSRFSSWLLSLKSLVKLFISDCKSCQYLPALEGLISLKFLEICYMDALEYICFEGNEEVFPTNTCSSSMATHTLTNFFPSLEKLEISYCESFRGWQSEANVNNNRNIEKHLSLPPFPCLLSLQIEHCPNLSCMPTFPNLVERLYLKNSNMKPLIDTSKVSATQPYVTGNLDRKPNPLPSLSMLSFLHIGAHMDIEALPDEWMQTLTSLKVLIIQGLSNLVTLFHHMRHLPATLELFNIIEVDNLDPWKWSDDKEVSTQNQALHCFHSLQTISIQWCKSLNALPKWICELQSLRHIVIEHCGNLESLPEGMHHLTNLESLHFTNCPLLKKRCKRGSGAEWPKIAQIPDIWDDF